MDAAAASNTPPVLVTIFFIVLPGIALYLLPSIIAVIRRMHALAGVITLNVLTGWTIAGWIASLIWAIVGRGRDDPAYRTIQPGTDSGSGVAR